MLAESHQTIMEAGRLIFRSPTANDSSAVQVLFHRWGGMGTNSRKSYVNLCEYFASTRMVVEQDIHIVTFISGCISTKRPIDMLRKH